MIMHGMHNIKLADDCINICVVVVVVVVVV